MRILVIVHWFPPLETAGTEVYTYNLAKALQARGHDLTVYYTRRRPDRPQYEIRRGTFNGLPYYEVVHNLEYKSFRQVYKNETMEAHFRNILEEIRPDVICIQHLHFHSIGYIGIIKQRKLPVIYTLAEYLNICLHNGWLATIDLELCSGPSPEKCVGCTRYLPVPDPKDAVQYCMAKASQPRHPLPRFLKNLKGRYFSAEESIMMPKRSNVDRPFDPWLDAVRLRWREIKEQLDQVDLFIAPSRFLLEQFVRSGMIDRERIIHSDYGFDHSPFFDIEVSRTASDRLRVGFIGQIGEHKGVNVLVQAFNGLPYEGVECQIWGSLDAFPHYVSHVQGLAEHPHIRWMGRYDNSRIAEVLGGLDVLVVPSLWFENSPLTIHEAFMAGIPVVTGNKGGMADLVEHEVNGLLFEIGDVDGLRSQLRRLLDEPQLIAKLRCNIPSVKSIDENARDMEEWFQALLNELARS